MSLLKSTSIFIVLLFAFYLGSALKPTYVENNKYADVNLEQVIPIEFSDWKVDDTLPIVLGFPEQDALLDTLYSQLLSRTYVNSKGNRVMLSIAYGDMQNKASQVHFPEVCYPAQGFDIVNEKRSFIALGYAIIPVKQLETLLGNRREFVTYWVRVGDEVALSRFKQKLLTIESGLRGEVSDGLLFRISTINLGDDYEVQKRFAGDMLSNLNKGDLAFLIGESIESE